MHRTRLAGGLVFALALMVFAPPAPAQTNRPVPPYTGFINADRVNIRCGPGLYYYPLVEAAQNTPVVVESESRGWLALRPRASYRSIATPVSFLIIIAAVLMCVLALSGPRAGARRTPPLTHPAALNR